MTREEAYELFKQLASGEKWFVTLAIRQAIAYVIHDVKLALSSQESERISQLQERHQEEMRSLNEALRLSKATTAEYTRLYEKTQANLDRLLDVAIEIAQKEERECS